MSQPIIDTRLLFRGTTPMAVIAVNGLPLADALQSMPPAALESTTLVEPKRKDFRKKPSAARRFVPAAQVLVTQIPELETRLRRDGLLVT